MLMTPCAVASVYFGALIDVAVAAAFVFGYYNIMRIENAHEMIVTESPSWFPASADSARQSFYCPAVNVTVFGTSLNKTAGLLISGLVVSSIQAPKDFFMIGEGPYDKLRRVNVRAELSD